MTVPPATAPPGAGRRLRMVPGLPRRAPSTLLVVLGIAVTSGQLWGGLYDISTWGPLAIAVAGCMIGVFLSRPQFPRASGALIAAALTAMAAASAASILWAESASQASLQAHRWALYAGVFLLALLLMRETRQRHVMLVVLGAAGGAVMLGITAVLALGDASALFFNMRLTEPLGYVNGQAAAIVMALWPALACAERARSPLARAGAAAAATVLAGLLLLTQSRGALLALILTAAVVVALVPGRVRRGWLLLSVAAGVAAVAAPLLDVYSSAPSARAQPADEVVHDAVRPLLLAGIVCAGAWALATHVAERMGDRRASLRSLATAGLVTIAAIGVAGSVVATGDPVARLRAEIDQFTTLDTGGLSRSRLLAGGGNRYDYWRVAVEEFRSAPLLGLGAGNYPRDYFRLRRTTEDIRQPHSLELQALSELGVLGGAAVAALLGGLLWACVGAARRVRQAREETALVVAATGIVVSWIAHSSVDWLHLLPSVTALMLCAAAALVPAGDGDPLRRPGLPATVAVVVLAVLAAAGIGRLTLADRFRAEARAALPGDPARAVSLADRARSLHGDDVATLYVRAAALARRDDYQGARSTLLRAAAAEPHNFVPRALLGDLALRRGDSATARREYAAALQLNPRDPTLRAAVAGAQRP